MATCFSHPAVPLAIACWFPFLRRPSLLLAATIGAVSTPWLARRNQLPRARTAAFLAVAMASHGIVDMATNGGLGIALLWPFSDARLFWPWQPIEVAPLGITAFFSQWGLEVLASELVWLWLPAIVIGSIGLAVRRSPVPRPGASG